MAGIKKEDVGFKKENWNSISSIYNIRYAPNVSVGKAAVRMIPCTYNTCIK